MSATQLDRAQGALTGGGTEPDLPRKVLLHEDWEELAELYEGLLLAKGLSVNIEPAG
jgi:hypothetical protein